MSPNSERCRSDGKNIFRIKVKMKNEFVFLYEFSKSLLFGVWGDFKEGIKSSRMTLPLIWLLSVGLAFQFDMPFYSFFLIKEGDFFHFLAEKISYWGDFPQGTVPLSIGIYLLGLLFKKERIKEAAIGCFLSAFIAGCLVDLGRDVLGRPRPSADVKEAFKQLGYIPTPIVSFHRIHPGGSFVDGFYGIHWTAMFHGFPSGHAATSMATASSFLRSLPLLGYLLLFCAVFVCWSRMALGRHYFSDIIAGGLLGFFAGLMFSRFQNRNTSTALQKSKQEVKK
ncbi:Membrane-associated phospholipid phosphatase [Methylacidiphilum infernorum V4]|uniref:Membrane-associated phospholipid phosphatase n=2 Tax=Candidatus Methylacidiphilum infernorum TaxID=511746 RepID=B3DVA9_METI4|nr:Membrane-associated phospholipid phosphatase [Methylacidiphilum infernorum V4]